MAENFTDLMKKKNICGYQATQPTPSGKIQKEPQRDTS